VPDATNTDDAPLVGVVDCRCFCPRCVARTEDIYRMIGTCWNCKATPILMIYRSGDPAVDQTCPLCEVRDRVYPFRLATPDEIPAAAQI
jgi:hypothetical protein